MNPLGIPTPAVGPAAPPADCPPSPWERCPRPGCGGNLILRQDRPRDPVDGTRYLFVEIVCHNCTHVLATWSPDVPGWTIRPEKRQTGPWPIDLEEQAAREREMVEPAGLPDRRRGARIQGSARHHDHADDSASRSAA